MGRRRGTAPEGVWNDVPREGRGGVSRTPPSKRERLTRPSLPVAGVCFAALAACSQLIDNMPKDLNRPWEDPMPDAGERLFTMELRGISVSG